MIIYKWFAIAQARHPRAVGRLMRLATSTVPKLVGHKHGGGSGANAGDGAISRMSESGASMGERGNPGMAPHETTTLGGRATRSGAAPVAPRETGETGATKPGSAAVRGAAKPQRDPKRTNGIRAANYAARVPGAR